VSTYPDLRPAALPSDGAARPEVEPQENAAGRSWGARLFRESSQWAGRFLVLAVALLPRSAMAGLLRRAVGTRRVALCLHQTRRDDEPPHPLADNSSRETDIDELIALLSEALPSAGQLTVTVDDGYAAAAAYVSTRAPRFPAVEWLYCVCPQKTEKGIGFRWDLLADGLRRNPARIPLTATEPPDPDRENERRDLAALAATPEYRLATVEECRKLAALPNVALGNHGNAHLGWELLTAEQAEQDIAGSLADFERLFGVCEHFAIPFGIPGRSFDERHIRAIRARTRAVIWTTEGRAYDPAERHPKALLPRFGVSGSWRGRRTAAYIALRCLKSASRPRAESQALSLDDA
jgi:hypothetical protein